MYALIHLTSRCRLTYLQAFEKIDQPYDDERKGFMWRLTKSAIRDGVKSTTRYRSKQPNKRGHRTQRPQPQRQASGAKGGQASHRSTKLRRSNRMQDMYRSEPSMPRSVPQSYDPTCNPSQTYTPYPSPYMGSDLEFGHLSSESDPCGPLAHHHLDLFPSSRSYLPTGISQCPSITDTAYFLKNGTNRPSLSVDEARTPINQGGWSQGLDDTAPYTTNELGYPQYMG